MHECVSSPRMNESHTGQEYLLSLQALIPNRVRENLGLGLWEQRRLSAEMMEYSSASSHPCSRVRVQNTPSEMSSGSGHRAQCTLPVSLLDGSL